MNLHEEMAFWGSKLAGESFEMKVGVAAAEPGEEGVAETLEALGDGEAHTIETLDAYLQSAGIDLSGCGVAACLVRLHLDGHRIKTLPPYDSFGCPQRFKLTGKQDLMNAPCGEWVDGEIAAMKMLEAKA